MQVATSSKTVHSSKNATLSSLNIEPKKFTSKALQVDIPVKNVGMNTILMESNTVTTQTKVEKLPKINIPSAAEDIFCSPLYSVTSSASPDKAYSMSEEFSKSRIDLLRNVI